MRIRLSYIPILILIIALLHFVALYSGLYDAQLKAGPVWWDNVLHVLVGITFGLAWLWILQSRGVDTATLLGLASTAAFVLIMALAWEGAEYVTHALLPDLAENLKIFSPTLTEASTDIVSNMLGAAALLSYLKLRTLMHHPDA